MPWSYGQSATRRRLASGGRIAAWGSALVSVATLLMSGCCSLRSGADSRLSAARDLTFHGLAALHRGKPDEAEILLVKASETCPDDHRIRHHLAQALETQGEIDRAIEQMKKAVTLSEGDPELHIALGNLNLQKGQPRVAKSQAQLALSRNRQLADAWLLKGKSEREMGDLGEALASLHRAAGYDSEGSEVQVEIAKTYRSRGEYRQALAALELHATRFPADQLPIEISHMIGLTLTDLSQYQRAASVLAQVAQRPAATPEIWLSLSRTQQLGGDISQARLTALAAAERFPGDPAVHSWVENLSRYVNRGLQSSSASR